VYLESRETKQWEYGGNLIIRNFITFTLQEIFTSQANQGMLVDGTMEMQ
jgi:hypothetical protein